VIIYLADDRAYLSWVAHHRHGFVLDWRRQPTRKLPIIHRANCPSIYSAKPTRKQWTTAHRLKACSLTIGELIDWATEESPSGYEYCPECAPQVQRLSRVDAPTRRLTRLGKEIVEYILEMTVIHLDRRDAGYRVTVGDLAQCFSKTPRQLFPILLRMSDAGYVQVEAPTTNNRLHLGDSCVLPTPNALRMLPAFAKVPESQLTEELSRLKS
jgi:hypothetical protein